MTRISQLSSSLSSKVFGLDNGNEDPIGSRKIREAICYDFSSVIRVALYTKVIVWKQSRQLQLVRIFYIARIGSDIFPIAVKLANLKVTKLFHADYDALLQQAIKSPKRRGETADLR